MAPANLAPLHLIGLFFGLCAQCAAFLQYGASSRDSRDVELAAEKRLFANYAAAYVPRICSISFLVSFNAGRAGLAAGHNAAMARSEGADGDRQAAAHGHSLSSPHIATERTKGIICVPARRMAMNRTEARIGGRRCKDGWHDDSPFLPVLGQAPSHCSYTERGASN